MHNSRLPGVLAKIAENSVVIVDYDNAGYIDPDAKAVLPDFSESAHERGIRLSQWPVALKSA